MTGRTDTTIAPTLAAALRSALALIAHRTRRALAAAITATAFIAAAQPTGFWTITPGPGERISVRAVSPACS